MTYCLGPWHIIVFTLARASLAASASAAIALWSWTGSLTSFLYWVMKDNEDVNKGTSGNNNAVFIQEND